MTGPSRDTPKRSLFALIGDLPTLLITLIKGEIELLKQELVTKAKHAGVGVGLLAAAGAFAFFALGVLVAAAILGIATALPAWLAALIVAAALLLIAALLVLIGVGQLKQSDPTPTETIDSVKEDVRTIQGIGK